MSMMNRLGNSKNPNQGDDKRVLCVCSAGLLRSPTAALVLTMEPFYYNTRAAGLSAEFALIVVDDVLLEWADEIVCMEKGQAKALKKLTKKPIICLDIEDSYAYRDQRLQNMIRTTYTRLSLEQTYGEHSKPKVKKRAKVKHA